MGLIDFLSVYSYRIIVIGTFLIGLSCGLLGSYLYLRRQSLLADVIGHASTLGVMGGFIIAASWLDIDGRSLLVLMAGALVTCLLAVFITDLVGSKTQITHDTAMAICLALFYGGGLVLLDIILNGSYRGKAGISSALLGKASALTIEDVNTIAVVTVICVVIVLLFGRVFTVFSFDVAFASIMGFPARIVSPLILVPTVLAIVLGVKAVGIILMVAFAIIPPCIARQWTNHVHTLVLFSGVIGGLSAVAGAWLSVSIGKVPTGPIIVVVLTAVLVFSLLFAPQRSILVQLYLKHKRRKEFKNPIPAIKPLNTGGVK